MSYAYKDEIWVQIICWFCLYPKPYYSPPRMSKCVIITVWCHHQHSGDVVCIQGRDRSTNHLLILFIQNPISVSAIANMCYCYCLMPTPTVEMSYAYKDEIWVQIICSFCLSKTLIKSAPYVKMCHYYCLMPKPTVEMSFAYKDEIWVQIICWFCLSKTLFLLIALLQSAPHDKIVSWLLFDAITDSGDVICIQGRDLSTNHLWFFSSKTPVSFTVRYHYRYLLGCIIQENW